MQGRALGGNRRQPLAAALLGDHVALRPFPRYGGEDRLVQRLGFRGQILVLADELRQPVVAGGEPHRELVDRRGGCGLGAALQDI